MVGFAGTAVPGSEILEQLTCVYTLRFLPDNPNATKDRFRRVTIRSTRDGVYAKRVTRGYWLQ